MIITVDVLGLEGELPFQIGNLRDGESQAVEECYVLLTKSPLRQRGAGGKI